MADRKLEKNMTNSRSCGNNLDLNFDPMSNMYQPSYGLPAPSLVPPYTRSNLTQLDMASQPPPPPPLPLRQQQPPINYQTSLYNNYNYPYNSYRPYNNNNNDYYNTYPPYAGINTFSEQAESTTRQAFESVESVVRTFSSIAMMLDSTYQAVFNSFRALLRVSDHMGQLKSHLSNILSSIALLRIIRFVVRKLKYIYALFKKGPKAANEELLWTESLHIAESSPSHSSQNANATQTWPAVVFFSVAMAGPWLLWKLLVTLSKNKLDAHQQWSKGLTTHYVAHANHDFEGRQADELTFKRASKLIVAPEEFQTSSPKGWLLASADGERVGLIPRNYVRIVSKQPAIQPLSAETSITKPVASEALRTGSAGHPNEVSFKNENLSTQKQSKTNSKKNNLSALLFDGMLRDEDETASSPTNDHKTTI